MTVLATTAEWHCTRCSTMNRKLVPSDAVEVRDRCVHCKTKHRVTRDRPLVWEASSPA